VAYFEGFIFFWFASTMITEPEGSQPLMRQTATGHSWELVPCNSDPTTSLPKIYLKIYSQFLTSLSERFPRDFCTKISYTFLFSLILSICHFWNLNVIVSHCIIQGEDWVLSPYVLSSCGLPLPPTNLLVKVNEAHSYLRPLYDAG
jgi:hypothetical protein